MLPTGSTSSPPAARSTGWSASTSSRRWRAPSSWGSRRDRLPADGHPGSARAPDVGLRGHVLLHLRPNVQRLQPLAPGHDAGFDVDLATLNKTTQNLNK